MKNKNMVLEIIKKELRDVLRDKKTLIAMMILPIVIYPIFMGAMLVMLDNMANEDESVYNTIGFAFETDDTLDTLIEEIGIQKQTGTEEELKTKLENEEINGYITLDDKEFTIYYSEKDTYGMATEQLSYALLEGYKQTIQSHILTSDGLVPDEIFNVYTIESKDISNKDASSVQMMSMLPSMIFLTTTVTAIMVAIDLTAGEKERGTLETLLTFPIKTSDIIAGKFLATTICTTISAIVSFASMYGVMYYSAQTLETFKGVEMLSLPNLIMALVMFIIFAMFISAVAIILSSSAKSFKEAQSKVEPLSILNMVPMMMSMFGTKLDITMSLIPFINVNLMLSDIISNTVNMQYFILTIVSNIVVIYISLKAISKLYKSDKILFS